MKDQTLKLDKDQHVRVDGKSLVVHVEDEVKYLQDFYKQKNQFWEMVTKISAETPNLSGQKKQTHKKD